MTGIGRILLLALVLTAALALACRESDDTAGGRRLHKRV